jgi:cell division protein FtsI/penicillin-binding protein 2
VTQPFRTLPALAGAVTATALLASSCTLGGGGRSAQEEARALATALSAGKPGTVSFSGGTSGQAQRLWDDVVARLRTGSADVRPDVRVTAVHEGDGDAPSTARLAYDWKLAGANRHWTYRTTATMTHSGDDRVGDDGWRVRLSPTLIQPDLRAGERLAVTHTLARRADILGAGGARLVTARLVVRFGIDKTRVPAARQQASARALARVLGIDAPAYAARVKAAGGKAFVEAIVLRPADARRALAHGAGRIRGAAALHDTLPLAPTRDFARPVLGTVGPVTAEIVRASDGVYSAGDDAGLSGLESRYDEQLRGTPGLTVEAVDDKGGTRELWRTVPVAGKPLRTTLEPRLQRLAERGLADIGPASALVAVRPSTGALLAVASGPGSGGYSTATVGRYAPGSTFKIVSSLALLRAGLTPSSTVSCPPTTVVDGKTFKNYSDYPPSGLGRITLATAVANSCNTAFVNERRTVSQADIADAAASLGLGVDHDTGFASYFGSVPGTPAEAGGETGHAASMIGQGRVLASPMAMAVVAASVAKGAAVLPTLLAQQHTGAATPAHPLTTTEARRLRSLLRGVVTRGSGALLADLPGPPALAKTGTAEFGTKLPLKTHAWMVGVHGDLAVAVFVDVGSSGSGTAGPVLKRFLEGAGG